MEKQPNDIFPTERVRHNQGFYRIWIIVLFLLVAFSSCYLGFILSSFTPPEGDGAIIDTMVLKQPDVDEDMSEELLPLSLSGVVCYEDGSTYKGGMVELHNVSKKAEPDSEGRFFFHDIGRTDHIFHVLDANGDVVAKMKLKVSSDIETGFRLTQTEEDDYELAVASDVILVEIKAIIDQKTGKVMIHEEYLTVVSSTGVVYTSEGLLHEKDDVILTPCGARVYPDGTIIFPSGRILLSDGSHYPPDKSKKAAALKDLYLKDRDLDITNVSSNTGGNNNIGVNPVIPGSNDDNSNSNEQKSTSPDEPEETEGQTHALIVKGGSGTGNYKEGTRVTIKAKAPKEGYVFHSWSGAGSNIDDATSAKTKITMPNYELVVTANYVEEEIDFPTDEQPTVYEGTESDPAKSWTQLSTIKLFGEGNTKLYPGIKGSYQFRVSNPNSYDISFIMSLDEANHSAGKLPLIYRLKRGDSYIAGDINTWLTPIQMSIDAVNITSGTSDNFTLEWQWPYNGNDALDTAIGSSADKEHAVTISMHIEQVTQ